MGWRTQTGSFVEKHERLERKLRHLLSEPRLDTSNLPGDLRKILARIHDDLFDSALNVNSLKARCKIRNNNVSTRFRSVLGIGIREYIETLRLEAAGRLLGEEEAEIYLVAMAVGYVYQETFCRAFQRHFGHSPSEHRPDAKALEKRKRQDNRSRHD